MSRYAWLIIIIMASSANVLAQTDKNDGASGGLGVSMVWKSGNTNLLQAKASGSLTYRSGRDIVSLVSRGSFGTKGSLRKASLHGSKVFVSSVFEHLSYRHEFLQWLSAEFYVQHEADRFRRLKTRVVGGLGPRAAIIPFENAEVSLATSYTLEYEARDSVREAERIIHRWSTYLQASYNIDKHAVLRNKTIVRPRFDDFSDIRILSQSSLKIAATTWFGVRLSLNVAYDSRPQSGIKKLDTGAESTMEFSF